MSFRRIVVALGTPGDVAVTTAVELARTLEAELLGLYLEDADLFDLAALPFAGEVGFPSAARRTFGVEALERGLRAQAERLRQLMMARLAGTPTRWTFEVVRGRVAVALAAAVNSGDLVVLPTPLVTPGRTRSRGRVALAFAGLRAHLLLVDETHRQPRALGVIAPASVSPSAIVDLLRRLAPYCGRDVQCVACGRVAAWDAWQRTTSGLLAAAGLRGVFRAIALPGSAELRRIVADEARGVVLALVDEPDMRNALLEVATIPLLLLPSAAQG